MTLVDLKLWICENGFNSNTGKFSPGMAKRVNKNLTIKEEILSNSPSICIGAKGELEPFICERILYIMNGIIEQKLCPVCSTPIHIKRECCSKKCTANDPNVRIKKEQTCLDIYGTTNPSYSAEIKNKISKKNKQHSDIALMKRKETNKEKYGVEFLFQDKQYKDKQIQTNLTRYGVDNYFKYKPFIESNKQYKKENPTDYTGSKLKRFKTSYINKTAYHISNAIPLFSEFDNHLTVTDMKYKCEICDKEFTRYSLYVRRCTNCFPVHKSIIESEIVNFIKSIYEGEIKSPDRTQIKPLELDIYIPEKNIAIEYDSFFYHSYGPDIWKSVSNENSEDKNYHLNKTILCLENNIKLFHIFEDEWTNPIKQNIWKSILKTNLGLNKKIGARKCNIRIVNKLEEESFLNEHHLQGYIPSTIAYGLYNDDILLSLISIGYPRFDKTYSWEIFRFVSKSGITIVGGFSKLLNKILQCHSGSILTYADKRYSDGNVYRSNGFAELSSSKPNYYYTIPRKGILESRYKYQKHKLKDKLEHYDESLSEAKNMFNNGWKRIWDCGNYKFSFIQES